MTRFNLTLSDGVSFVLKCLQMSQGGEIFVPKIPSYKIMDLVKAISTNAKVKFIGRRSGEKIHEEMITKSDSFNSLEFKDFFIIFPDNKNTLLRKHYIKKYKGKKIDENFSYNSKDNKYLTISNLRKLIKKV